MLDSGEKGKGAVRCTEPEAVEANGHGFGIFQTVNDFGDDPRRKECLKSILAWAVDIDEGSKERQRDRIQKSPLVPSIINETKAGYHVWFFARPGATPEGWVEIVKNRMVNFFGADPNAADVCRILRAPGYVHWKDPEDPFLICTVFKRSVTYSEDQMLTAFEPPRASKEVQRLLHTVSRKEYKTTDTFWEAVYNLDCAEGLVALSGSPLCGGEVFSFRRTGRGTTNVLVDGKTTSVWIDENRRIGSSNKGGPTLYQWLRWYGVSPRESVAELKRIFPHLETIEKGEKG